MSNVHRTPSCAWLTEVQVSQMVGVSLSKLRADRQNCCGLPYAKFGRSVRYDIKDVEAFLNGHKCIPQA